MMSDVVSLAASTNASEGVPDEKKALPTACQQGRRTLWSSLTRHACHLLPTSSAMLDIVEAVDAITSGGPNSFGSYFGLLLGPGLSFLLALPRNEWTAPEEPLPRFAWG